MVPSLFLGLSLNVNEDEFGLPKLKLDPSLTPRENPRGFDFELLKENPCDFEFTVFSCDCLNRPVIM